jgi:hypothetical protein
VEEIDKEFSKNGENKKYFDVKHHGKIKYATARYRYEGNIIIDFKFIDYMNINWIELDVIRGFYIVLFWIWKLCSLVSDCLTGRRIWIDQLQLF